MLDLYKKYKLPSKITVLVKRNPDGTFIARFPDLPGCLTEADNIVDIIYYVNDAIYTYFDMERKDLKNVDFLYYPPKNFLSDIKEAKPKPSMRKKVEFQHYYPSYSFA